MPDQPAQAAAADLVAHPGDGALVEVERGMEDRGCGILGVSRMVGIIDYTAVLNAASEEASWSDVKEFYR